jgi:hypothetical protein
MPGFYRNGLLGRGIGFSARPIHPQGGNRKPSNNNLLYSSILMQGPCQEAISPAGIAFRQPFPILISIQLNDLSCYDVYVMKRQPEEKQKGKDKGISTV